MQALGLIEVVGYPPAIEAADAALKAANVTLLSIAKADAGIMTVEIVGDVGAVTASVDAGARSAASIGFVRARHVIPRVESELIGKVVPVEHVNSEITSKSSDKIIATPKPDTEDVKKLEKLIEDDKIQVEHPSIPEVVNNEETPTIDFSQEQLSKRSNANLRNLIQSLGIDVGTERLNGMKKQDLIRLLLEYNKKHEK